MFKKNYKNRGIKITFSTLLAMAILSIGQTVSANFSVSSGAMELIKSSCPAGPNQYKELVEIKHKIATAASLSDARQIALSPTDTAITALKRASSLVPFSDDLRAAETRLSDARHRILLAASQEQVSDEFDGMMLAGLDNDQIAHVKVGSGGCSYSTGELIGIVIGLILGIIPGLILLVLLC